MDVAGRLRVLAGDTIYKLSEVDDLDRTYLLEDLVHRIVSLADELEGQPVNPSGYVPAYEMEDETILRDNHYLS